MPGAKQNHDNHKKYHGFALFEHGKGITDVKKRAKPENESPVFAHKITPDMKTGSFIKFLVAF